MLALYVNDLLIAAGSIDDINWEKRKLSILFKMKDLGEAKVRLELKTSSNWEKSSLILPQKTFIVDVSKRFCMSGCKPETSATENPGKSGTLLERSFRDTTILAVSVPYQETITCLMMSLMTGSRPDIAYAVGKLLQFCKNPQ